MSDSFISEAASRDAPTITNEKGGKQSHIPTRFDLIDARAMFAMAKVLHEGAEKYGANNWRLIGIDDHLNHALNHIFAYLAGDRSDDHLSHLLCRATFACGVELADEDGEEKAEDLSMDYYLTAYFISDFAKDPVEGIFYQRNDGPFAGRWLYTKGRWRTDPSTETSFGQINAEIK